MEPALGEQWATLRTFDREGVLLLGNFEAVKHLTACFVYLDDLIHVLQLELWNLGTPLRSFVWNFAIP